MREYRLSSVKACISGAAALPVEVQEAFEKLTRGRLVEGYGLTEASPVTPLPTRSTACAKRVRLA
ncbi:MAG: AMP-binding protein [Chloroflexi bacterium]|nr:AMP-binding protein [Chloroflexota bacterium]